MRTSRRKFPPSLKLPSYSVIAADTLRDLVTLTFWPWSVVIHGGSRGQPLHQIWRSYSYRLRLFMNFWLKFWHHHFIPSLRFPYRARYFESWHLPWDTIDNAFAATVRALYHMTYA